MRSCSFSFSRNWLLIAQCGIGVATLGAMTLPPPVIGKMLLVPLTPAAKIALVPLATERGARLIATGPLPGSLVVSANGATIVGPLFQHGILTIAAPPAGCFTATEIRA